jgi:hypothetical protein
MFAGFGSLGAIFTPRSPKNPVLRVNFRTDAAGTPSYTDPHILIAYSDGEVRQEFTFVYAAEIESGELKIDDESKEAAWVPLPSAVELRLTESQRLRLKDVMEYQKEGRTLLR